MPSWDLLYFIINTYLNFEDMDNVSWKELILFSTAITTKLQKPFLSRWDQLLGSNVCSVQKQISKGDHLDLNGNRCLVFTLLCVSKCSCVSNIDQLVLDRWPCKQLLLQQLPVPKLLVMHLLSSITIFFTIHQVRSIGFTRTLVW